MLEALTIEALTQGAGIYSSRRAGQTGAAAADGPARAAADGKTQIAQALTCTFLSLIHI